ncbi:amidohydrolase family protein [Patescibacteria group bacterium]|nr:amidohydrolase family protein [Patescibacteria group bacterium]
MVKYWNIKEELLSEIKKHGGWVNCHAHIDRAYTITRQNFYQSQALRSEKWTLNDELRRRSTVDQIYDRMAQAVERMLEQGVTVLGSFIDVDYLTKDKAIKAAIKIREKYKDQITIKYLMQSSNGLFNQEKEARQWFELAADFVDIIGGLVKADVDREPEHFDILLSTAKAKGKMLHVHVDELNLPEERETELLAHKTIEHGMQGKVVAIHGISLNARPKTEREAIYTLMKKAGMMVISCPVSWLNERRSEELSPIHNPITPVDELLPHQIPVGIGTDNIADIWMPWNDGDMWMDLRVLLEAARIYDIDQLVQIATTNGRKILGVN